MAFVRDRNSLANPRLVDFKQLATVTEHQYYIYLLRY